ncbi:MAG: PQQ-binding-like beta-propeller repeat protein [Pseudomonadota bacterium]
MKANHAAAALAWASLLALGNVHVISVLQPPRSLKAPIQRHELIMQAREGPFESARSPVVEEASVIPDHLVLPDGETHLRPHVPPPRTRHGWVYPLPDDVSLLPHPIQAGWFQGWTLSLPESRAPGSPAAYDGAVYVAGGAGSRDVYSLDAITGIPLWSVRLSEEGPASLAVVGRHLAVAAASGTVFVLSTFDGTMIWSRRHVGAYTGSPVLTEEVLIGGHLGPEGYLITAANLENGDPLWEASIDGRVLGAPVVDGGLIYVATDEGSVYCIDAQTGLERWSEPLGAWSTPRIDGSQILVACANPWSPADEQGAPGLLRVTLSAGLPFERVVWGPREAGEHVRLVSRLSVGMGFSGVPAAGYPMQTDARQESAGDGPAAFDQGDPTGALPQPWTSGGDICIAAHRSIRCADLKAGSLRWEWTPPSDLGPSFITGTPALSPTSVITASTRGDLAALQRQDGEVQWTLRLGEPVTSSPILKDGWLYVTTSRGRVFGVDLHEPADLDATPD